MLNTTVLKQTQKMIERKPLKMWQKAILLSVMAILLASCSSRTQNRWYDDGNFWSKKQKCLTSGSHLQEGKIKYQQQCMGSVQFY